MKLFISTLYFLSVSIPLFAQTYIGDEKEITQILENVSAFSQHVMDGDHEAVGKCYTSDAKIFPNNRDIIAGQEDVTTYWKMPEGVAITYHKVTPEEIKIIGDEAYDYGYYEGKTKSAERGESSWGGKYVIIWRKVEGEWKIYLDIWNSRAKK
ncbi:MAG: nuclear transport factor 2 family protein [Bacteroidota bacterium]